MTGGSIILDLYDMHTLVALGIEGDSGKRVAVAMDPQEALDVASRIKQLAKRARAQQAKLGPRPTPEETAHNLAAINTMQVGDTMIDGKIVSRGKR
jgi:hypothetical protein